jgi:hypothetical protein
MAMVNQYTGTRNGNPNLRLYPLAAQAPSVFHDVASGTNAVPCAGGSPGCSAAAPSTNIGHMNGYSAGAGYDLATGWGSVDAYSLASRWSNVMAPPTIVSLSPNPMTGSSASQTLTINGSGFQSGLKVLLSYPGSTSTLQGTQIASVTALQIQLPVNVGTTVRTWSVQVVNSNNQASNAASLQVVAPVVAPAITSLNPNPMTGSNSNQILTVTGGGFQSGSGLKVLVSYTGYSATIQGAQLAYLSAAQIQVLINVGTMARTWSVQVVNPNGQATSVASLQVVAPPAAPVIASVSPNPMTGSNSNQTLTINGSGFQSGSGLRVLVGFAGYTAMGSQVKWVSGSQITASINVGTGARSWLVEVINPNGQASNVAAFQVSALKTAAR